ncbi:hypothetical protein TWF730_002514 [Orbilia blumenaviensis]|uniref:CBM-cenC domain-containing protein n=1 Tax=Orbilia blumenaviensis TaxID=1796055 RepID=A0AAV9UAZ7_9PEZI
MKSTLLLQTLLAVAIPATVASPIDKVARYIYAPYCRPNHCSDALERDPAAASSTCDEILGRTTPTVVVTSYSFVNTTATSTLTETVYEATITSVVLPPEPTDPALVGKRYYYGAVGIDQACGYNLRKLSSACGCFLGFDEPTPTTITTIIPTTFSDSVAVTTTTNVPGTLVTTSTCYPAATPAIQNGDFESGLLSPWYIVPGGSDTQPGTYSIAEDATTPNPLYAFIATVSMPDPGFSYRKVNIAQDLTTCPGATYNLSFNYKFEGDAPAACYIVTFINGVEVLNFNNGPSSWTPAATTFVAGSSTTVLRIDFVIGSAFGTENLSIDGISIVPA